MNNFDKSITEIWKTKQLYLKELLILDNLESWQEELNEEIDDINDLIIPNNLKLVGGIDISFDKNNNKLACVCFAVIDSLSRKLVKKHEKIVSIIEPYIVNYLAFRECEHMVNTIKEFLVLYPEMKPQVILVDGNGVYHTMGFGSACQLGVRLEQEGIDIPTVGVAKNYLQLHGMPSRENLKEKIADLVKDGSEILLDLFFEDQITPICTVRRCDKSNLSKDVNKLGKLAFISAGHRITLRTAVNVVRICSKCRMPEPILLADHLAKNFLDKRKNALDLCDNITDIE